LRRIGDGEHAAVGLGLQFHAARFKPRHRVAHLKVFEGRQQRPPAARISGDQFTRIEASMGDIAATAAGNADFGEKLRAAFEHRHFGIGRGLGAGDGGKKTRRAAADHDDPS
jgi:hypothetical protein